METKAINTARFDTRLSKEQKEFFEYVAGLGGFRTLTEFIMSALQEKAKIIIEKHNTTLSSKKDREVFFHAMVSPPKPNARLKTAASRYKKAANKK